MALINYKAINSIIIPLVPHSFALRYTFDTSSMALRYIFVMPSLCLRYAFVASSLCFRFVNEGRSSSLRRIIEGRTKDERCCNVKKVVKKLRRYCAIRSLRSSCKQAAKPSEAISFFCLIYSIQSIDLTSQLL